jgi:class 3 adenylate cyclase
VEAESKTLAPVASTNTPACVICGTALAGPLSYLFRLVGISRSSRNPNLCNRCNTHVEEGRVVELTVLFADLSSFTELTHRLGPERTHAVVDAFLKSATFALVKHGAFIDKYVGDAVMAFFNAPIRYDDHGARAVAAALEIQAEMPALTERFEMDLQASIGIASGWAHVGRLGSGEGRDYTAIGDVVNLAARLEAKANSGEVLVDEPVYRHVAEQFSGVAPETVDLKGFAEPVTSYRLGGSDAATARPLLGNFEMGGGPRRRAVNIGAVVFALLGAPCAAVTLIGPLAVVLGLGSAFAALGVSVLPFLDSAPIRIPMLTLSTLAAFANLYTVWHARTLRLQAAAENRFVAVTRLERQRTVGVIALACVSLFFVVFELYAHQFVTHNPWP